MKRNRQMDPKKLSYLLRMARLRSPWVAEARRKYKAAVVPDRKKAAQKRACRGKNDHAL